MPSFVPQSRRNAVRAAVCRAGRARTTLGAVRRSTAVRAAAVTVLAAGVAAPLLRRRLGLTPTLRLQRAHGTPGSFKAWEKLLVWSHWVWFAFPHGTVLYVLLRHPERFPRAAARIYATFDIG